jgi:multidrug efflux pump subunit AcrB
MTLALSPAAGYAVDLATIRELADNQIKEELLRSPGIANVEVFGGHQPEIQVIVDPDRLDRFGVSLPEIMGALSAQNQNIPQGLLIQRGSQYLFKIEGAARQASDLEQLVVARRAAGTVHLRDVARVRPGTQEPQSAYHGNGTEAIGVNILRAQSGHALEAIAAAERVVPSLKDRFPFIDFAVSYTQKDLIDLSVTNMLDALRDAILITVLVIFLFLGSVRTTVLCAISIPFTYLITFAVMWMFGFEFHMVTLTGVILAVGMLLDDAIVVIENIERHYREKQADVRAMVAGGTEEVMLAIFSGTYATIVVLLPIIFIGGYVQTVLRPLSLSLSIALVASYVVSVTIIPILAPLLLRAKHAPSRLERIVARASDRFVHGIRDFFLGTFDTALRHRFWFVAGAVVLLVVTMKVVRPLVGQDVQPPMDTGIIKINFEADANSSLAEANGILARMEAVIRKEPGVVSMSSTLGSEASVVSFGSGRNPQQGTITVNLVDRYHRTATIWEAEERFRQGFRQIPGLKFADVFDYGATAMSSIRAAVDVMVTGPDPQVLNQIGDDVQRRLAHAGGLASVSRTWGIEKRELLFVADRERCAYYGISPRDIATQVQVALQGGVASVLRVPNEDGFPIRVRYAAPFRDRDEALATLKVHTPMGEIPLSALGTMQPAYVPTLLTRQSLRNSIDVYGYRERAALSHIMNNVQGALRGLPLPAGYTLSQEGDAKQGAESSAALMSALMIGMVLLYFSLIPAFRSFRHPLTIMSVIPLAMIGATWSLLASGKHQSTAAFMGVILLAGIVVKNSILLIDFVEMAREKGMSTLEALRESVRVRTRPILMTAFGTAVGMVPIAMERAIGLERLSPLAVVAIGGLMVATFLTLLYVPIFYTLFEDLHDAAVALRRRLFAARRLAGPAPAPAPDVAAARNLSSARPAP